MLYVVNCLDFIRVGKTASINHVVGGSEGLKRSYLKSLRCFFGHYKYNS